MSTYEERQRKLAEITQRAREAVTAHSLSDDETELGLLDLGLDDQQVALDQLAEEDPVGAVWFGEDDGWVDARLSRKASK